MMPKSKMSFQVGFLNMAEIQFSIHLNISLTIAAAAISLLQSGRRTFHNITTQTQTISTKQIETSQEYKNILIYI